MGKREIMQIVNKHWRMYHINGMSPIHTIRRNVIFISVANSIEHELEKTRVCWELRSMNHEFITEAVDNKTGLRRDIVDLNTGIVIEVETTPERALRFLDESTLGNAKKVIIRPCGWSFTDAKWIQLKEKHLKEKDI